MLTSKQRAKLRSMANGMDCIMQVGKGGIVENLVVQVSDALRARELIKMSVLENCLFTAKEAANELAEQCGADVVQVIGKRFVLYKRNEEMPVINID